MGLRLAATAFTIVGFAVTAAPAGAFDYCVGEEREGCSGAGTSVQTALTVAANNPGPDRVLIGHGDFVVPSGGLVYNSPNRVEIRGISPTTTRLLQANETPSQEDALSVSDSASGDSVVADLQIVVGNDASGPVSGNVGLHMGQNSRVENVAVRAAPGLNRGTGLLLDGQTVVTGLDVDLGFGANGTTAILASGTAVATIADSRLLSANGIQTRGGSGVTILRTSLESSFECVGGASTVEVHDVLCRLSPVNAGASAYGIAALDSGSVTARNVTVTGGNANTHGAYASATSSGTTLLTITDSIVRVPGHSLGRTAFDVPEANIVADRNDFDPAATPGDNSGPGSITSTNARTDDPRFVGGSGLDALRLGHDSPLIDAGNPTAPPTGDGGDYNGAERVRDGNGDGSARIDFGAFEYQRLAPPAPTVTATPASAQVGAPFTFGTSVVDPDGDPVAFHWAFDDGAAADGASVSHAFAAPGTHSANVIATDATGLTSTGAATVTTTPAPTPPGPGPVTPPDTVAPRFSILRRGLRLSRTNTIPIRVTCSATERERCAGMLTLASTRKVAPRKKVLQLGKVAFSAAPGKTVIVRVKVSRKNAKIARRLRKLNVTAVGVARDRAGNKATVRRTATLITATPKRK